MLLLAFDSSTPISAVSVVRDAHVLGEDNGASEQRHGDVLLPRIETLLQSAGLKTSDVELVVVGVGPGSFTGLRIGLATAKGLALATGVAVRGVCSLEVLARGALDMTEPVVTMVDAGKGEVFSAVHARSADGLRTLLAPQLGTPAEGARAVAALQLESAVLCGSGARRHAAEIAAILGPRVRLLAPSHDLPLGRCVAEAGRSAWLAHGPSDLATLEPSYLRDSVATLPEPKLAI